MRDKERNYSRKISLAELILALYKIYIKLSLKYVIIGVFSLMELGKTILVESYKGTQLRVNKYSNRCVPLLCLFFNFREEYYGSYCSKIWRKFCWNS